MVEGVSMEKEWRMDWVLMATDERQNRGADLSRKGPSLQLHRKGSGGRTAGKLKSGQRRRCQM